MGVLDGVSVLDFSVWRPGPYATQLLAEMGAEVTKVEPPGGDPMRGYPALFAMLNERKRSVELDLKSDGGREQAYDMAAGSDIAVEGWRPGVAARLGVAYDDLQPVNPRIVYCSISGFGATGPLADAPGHDINYQAYAGMLAPDGRGAPPHPTIPVGDLAGGMAGALAICAAYAGRLRTGDGAFVDVSMSHVLASWVRPTGATGTTGVPRRNASAAYGTFATADGLVALGIVSEDHFWDALCHELGLDDLVGLGMVERDQRVDELHDLVAEAIADQPRDDLVERLGKANVPVSPVLTRAEMVAHPVFDDPEMNNGARIRTTPLAE